MDETLTDYLVDPLSRAALRLEAAQRDADGNVQSGRLVSKGGNRYPIRDSIPRFVATDDKRQRQTAESFSHKWSREETYSSPSVREAATQWFVEKYGFRDLGEMRRFFRERGSILDAGCGSGFSSSLWMLPCLDVRMWVGVDISDAIDIARKKLGSCPATHFVQGDIVTLPFREACFDVVISEGVLHHTPDTRVALRSVVSVLRSGGEILFYVYRRKAPIREFTDDWVREEVSDLPPEEAWERLKPLTKLGKALSDLHAVVTVPEDIPLLGIKAGKHDVQRLIYWHFAKLYWREEFSFDENHHVNFDWYHPKYAHRHTEEEIREWCEEFGLAIKHLDAAMSGFTVRAVKE
jgi:arsenite methyltransferase